MMNNNDTVAYSMDQYGVLLIHRCVVFLLLMSGSSYGQNIQSQNAANILISNVRLIDRDGKTEDVVVNILIKANNLELVTKDVVNLEQTDLAFNAQEHVLLGKLEIGNPASFLILDQDPRENAKILLDTKQHTIFAVLNGEIVLNNLSIVSQDIAKREEYSRWQTYAPPPIALPLSYQSNRKWNVLKTKPVTAILAAAMIVENTRWVAQDVTNKEQVGDLNEFDGGSIRGARVGTIGTINFKNPWTFILFFGTNAFERGFEQGELKEYVLFDYKIGIPLGQVTMTLGKQKEPISMERLTGLMFLPQQERTSVSDGLLPARNTGIVFNGNALNSRMSWAGGAFNRWFEIGQSFSETSSQIVGRLTGLPFITDDESNLFHMGIGVRYSNAREGIRYRTKAEIFRSSVFVDTDELQADGSFTYNIELAWRKGPVLLTSELMRANVISTTLNNPNFGGYHITCSWIVTGEMRDYQKRNGLFDRIKVAKGVNSGGWGAFEFTSRWSSLNLSDQSIEGGKMNTLSTGLNWWPGKSVDVNVNYRYTILDNYNQQGHNHGIVTRLVFILE